MKERSGNGLRFMLAYRELVKYIHLFMPTMTKDAMIGVIEEIYSNKMKNE